MPLGTPYGLGISFRLPYAPDFMLYLTAQSIDRIVLHVTHVRSLGTIEVVVFLFYKVKLSPILNLSTHLINMSR